MKETTEKKIQKIHIPFWDILKGIGIVSIVFGHSQYIGSAIATVYFYHIALFFFISGYFYNEKREGDIPFVFFARRLQRLWIPYITYGLLFVFMHNFFASLSMFPASSYETKDFISNIFSVFLLNCSEPAAGAMWFVPLLLGTTAFFAGLMWFCRYFLPKNLKLITLGILCVAVGFFGAVLNWKSVYLSYHLHTSLLLLPIYFLGYFLRATHIEILQHIKWYTAAVCIVFLYYCLNTGYRIELSMGVVPKHLFFFLISFTGIYTCCFIGKCIQSHKLLSRIFSILGSHSFDIMALHFVVFKTIDLIYGHFIHASSEELGIFPHSFWYLNIVYLILGITVPIFIGDAGRKFLHSTGNYIKNRI